MTTIRIVPTRKPDSLVKLIEETYWNDTSTYHTSPEFMRELTNEQQLSIRQGSMEREDCNE